MLEADRLNALITLHDAPDATVLKETERGRITRVPFDAHSDAVCKEDRPASLRSRLGVALRGSRAARALAASQALAEAGFLVPEPLGLYESDGRSVFVARHVEGPTLQDALAASDPLRQGALALAAAVLTARLHRAGFAFRDLKPPNLLVGETDLIPVDLDDVTRPRRLPRRRAWRNLAALDAYAQLGPHPLSVRNRWAALTLYAVALGGEPADHLAPVLARSRAKRRRWRSQHVA